MKARRLLLLAGIALAVSGCYRQVVQTGRTPGPTVIDMPWVSTWLWGLVPAEPIDVTNQCRSGIATVMTEQTFMNGLVTGLTLGIYSPRHVTVTCATGSAALPTRQIRVEDASEQAALHAMQRAVYESERTGESVTVYLQPLNARTR